MTGVVVRLSGTVPGRPATPVRTSFRRADSGRWRDARGVKTDESGSYATREFDLTGATKNRLDFGSTGTILSSR